MSAQRAMPSSRLYDDTEEDLVGADWHQHAIRSLSDSLADLAAAHQLPWHVGDRLTLIASKPDGTPWRPSPDIMLHPQAGSATRAEMTVQTDGVPALVIEVASPTTWAYDVDTRAGKAWGYLALGVPNYLVFDPRGELLGTPCRGWQQEGSAIREWQPDADGRYQALGLDVALQAEGDLLRIFDPAGRPVLFGFEKALRIRVQAQELDARTRELDAQVRRIAELEAELERLRGQN